MSRCGDDVACVAGGKFKVCFVNLYEGRNGDYDPNDSEDAQLLRIDIYEKTERTPFHGSKRNDVGNKTEWEIASDGSACTGITVNAPAEHLDAVLKMVLGDLEHIAERDPKKDPHSMIAPRFWADAVSWFDDEMAAEIFEKGWSPEIFEKSRSPEIFEKSRSRKET